MTERLVKFIYDDRDRDNQGWFVREYLDGGEVTEYAGATCAPDASINELIEACNIQTAGTEFELYRSITHDQAEERL